MTNISEEEIVQVEIARLNEEAKLLKLQRENPKKYEELLEFNKIQQNKTMNEIFAETYCASPEDIIEQAKHSNSYISDPAKKQISDNPILYDLSLPYEVRYNEFHKVKFGRGEFDTRPERFMY